MKDNMFNLTTHSPEETQQIGISIGQTAQAGDLILLVGNLGAGKTCLTQGICWGAGFNGFASSPSFVLVKEYQGRLMIYHIDLYRLDDIEEIAELGLDDYLYSDGLCVIEWADKAPDYFPSDHLLISIDHVSEIKRNLRIEGNGLRYTQFMEQLKEKWN